MDVSEFSYVWTIQRDDYVLVASEYEYAIVNKKEQTMLCISDDEVDAAVVEKMLEEGNLVYEDILDAYSDGATVLGVLQGARVRHAVGHHVKRPPEPSPRSSSS